MIEFLLKKYFYHMDAQQNPLVKAMLCNCNYEIQLLPQKTFYPDFVLALIHNFLCNDIQTILLKYPICRIKFISYRVKYWIDICVSYWETDCNPSSVPNLR